MKILIATFLGSFLLISCAVKKKVSSNAINVYWVYKIDSVNSYYLIYAKKRNELYKIVSKKGSIKKCEKIMVGKGYDFQLFSFLDQQVVINGTVIPSRSSYINGYGFDDSTTIHLERDSISDLYGARNIYGLFLCDE